MNLQKRNCIINIELTPLGEDFLQVTWDIGGDHHVYKPSAVMCGQFWSFMDALFALYYEERYVHRVNQRRTKCYLKSDDLEDQEFVFESSTYWDEEGCRIGISFSRAEHPYAVGTPEESLEKDIIDVAITIGSHMNHYSVDGRELCYAVSKACTECLKRYGFYGYFFSTGSYECAGDIFDINQLLFLKAYALDVMDIRSPSLLWECEDDGRRVYGTSFSDEIELLLFDM